MSRKGWFGAMALVLAGTSGVAWACADSGCEVAWTLSAQEMDCASRAMLAPGNDTRVNMLLLLRDSGGLDTAGLRPVAVEINWRDREGKVQQDSVQLLPGWHRIQVPSGKLLAEAARTNGRS